jgi:hypothetical protein
MCKNLTREESWKSFEYKIDIIYHINDVKFFSADDKYFQNSKPTFIWRNEGSIRTTFIKLEFTKESVKEVNIILVILYNWNNFNI